MSVPANSTLPSSMATRPWRQRLLAVAGLAVTAVFLALIWTRIDPARVVAALSRVSWTALAVAAALLAGAYTAKITRWHVMLTSVAPSVSWSTAAQTLLASVALNNVLPFRAGDVARVFAFRDRLAIPASALVPMLVLERILDAGMLLILAGLVAIPAGSQLFPKHLGSLSALGAVAVLGIVAVAVAAGPGAQALTPYGTTALSWLPTAVRQPASQALDVLARQLRGWQGAKLALLSALAWGLEGGMLAALATGFGFSRPILAGYFSCALATLATLIPSSPGFFGTFHAAAIAAVEVFGASPDQAAAYAILAHGIMWAPLTLLGLACLAWLSAHRLLTPAAETP